MTSRGGKRPGAGRKPSTIKGIVRKLPKESAELLLAKINANSKWISLANSSDERIQLETLKYLTDRAYGKARPGYRGKRRREPHPDHLQHSPAAKGITARQAIEASAGQGSGVQFIVHSILDRQ